jgi:hypothetical protein
MFERCFNFSVKLRIIPIQCFSIEIRLGIRRTLAAIDARVHVRRVGRRFARREALDDVLLFQNAMQDRDAKR